MMEKSYRSGDTMPSLAMSQSIQEKEELDYFLGELENIEKINEVPLMTRRLQNHQEDPMQELLEIYQEVKETEAQLKKSINIGSKYLFIPI